VPQKPSAPVTGWGSWNQYYTEVTQEDILANAQAAAELGLTHLLLDDGWELEWGVWEANEKFPLGMAGLAAELQAEGLVPSLWMAPFLVDLDAPVYAEYPGWWLKNQEGEVIVDQGRAVLDITAPGASSWLSEQIQKRVAEGWAFLKLDFLYAEAMEGVRYEPLTGLQAWERGMELVRAAAGDAWILGCGAPLLPSVGLVQSFRTGPDVAFEVDPDPEMAYLRSQVRSTVGRGFTDAWWWIDPDVVIAREPFTIENVRAAVVAQSLSGGTWMLGDDLVALEEERLSLLLDLDALQLLGQRARPVSPLSYVSGFDGGPLVELGQKDDRVPVYWEFPNGTVALLNVGEEAVEVSGPGGVELLTGEEAEAGIRRLEAGSGELWADMFLR
jgi:alpha-galactosidase